MDELTITDLAIISYALEQLFNQLTNAETVVLNTTANKERRKLLQETLESNRTDTTITLLKITGELNERYKKGE